MNDVLHCQDLCKIYAEGPLNVTVLSGVQLSVQAGESVAIVGASGSGKSTLLHLLGGLDRPTRGAITVFGQRIDQMDERLISLWRNTQLGFIYQFHHLLAEFSALENVMMPLFIRRQPKALAAEAARAVLEQVGLGTRLMHKPSQLSGGERQRVAIARALVTRPVCLLADEPTGNLDHQTALTLIELMLTLKRQFNTSILVVTHDLELAARLDRRLWLSDGALNQMT